MIKKLFIILLVCSFFNLAVTPAFVNAESDADTDRRQGRAVLGAIGLVALVGVFFMLSKMSKDDFTNSSSFAGNKSKDNFKIDFEVYQPDYDDNSFSENNNNFAPAVNVIYSW